MVELSHRLPSASLTSTPRRVGFQFSVVFWLSACLTMWACGDGPAGPGDTTPPQVASVVLTPASATLVSLGETVQLAASARDGSGNPMSGKTFTWSSSDGGVATVSSSGLVTAVTNGSTTITATTGGVSGTASVSVAQAVASVEVAPASATLVSLGETVQLIASALDANGSAIPGKTFTWSSSDGGVATVSSSGLVTAVADGSATISATGDAMSGTATVDVTIPTPDVAGYWTGLTSQGLSISFHVTDQDVLEQLSVRIKASVYYGSCTADFSQDEDVMVTGGVFAASVTNQNFTTGGVPISVAVRGFFSTSSSGTGSIDGFSGPYLIKCGGTVFGGSGGTLWGDLTWQASPVG